MRDQNHVVDDHLLLRILLGDEPRDLRPDGGRVLTTGLWYHRLARSLTDPSVSRTLSGAIGRAEPAVGAAAIEAMGGGVSVHWGATRRALGRPHLAAGRPPFADRRRGVAGLESVSVWEVVLDLLLSASSDPLQVVDPGALSSDEAAYVADARAGNTLRGHRSDWAEWCGWSRGTVTPRCQPPPKASAAT